MIDEKKLIENIHEKLPPERFGERCNALDVLNGVLQVIDEQPPAYNIDNVIKQLEELINNIEIQYCNNYEQGLSDGYTKALKVVEAAKCTI